MKIHEIPINFILNISSNITEHTINNLMEIDRNNKMALAAI